MLPLAVDVDVDLLLRTGRYLSSALHDITAHNFETVPALNAPASMQRIVMPCADASAAHASVWCTLLRIVLVAAMPYRCACAARHNGADSCALHMLSLMCGFVILRQRSSCDADNKPHLTVS